MPSWLWPALSLLGAIGGAYLGVRLHIVKLETEMAGVLERLKLLGERSHAHAQRIHEHGMSLHDLEQRLARLERKDDER